MSYTVQGKREQSTRVDADLEAIASRLLSDFPGEIEALVLVGSFGRGEGTIVVRQGELCPVHDYDIVIVSKDDLPRERLSQAASELAASLGLPHIDLFSYRRGQLASFAPSLFSLDLKAGGKVFHGDPNALQIVRSVDPSDLPLDEARRLMFNRLPSLIESVHEGDFRGAPEGDDAFRIAYMASRVILACVEALLIEAQDYHPSCRERESRFLSRFKRYRCLGGLVRTATAIKLHGVDASFDVIRYWLWARRFYLSTLFRVVCASYETPLADWWDLSSFYDRWFYFFWRRLVTRLFNTAKYQEWGAIQRRVRLELAEIFLLLARESRGQVRPHYLERAGEYLKSVTGTANPSGWEEIRRQVVEWDFKILHPH